MTSEAAQFARDNIFMNSVDPGWISQQVPIDHKMPEDRVPLDEVDAAARICDPIFVGETTELHEYGKFLKDYVTAPW